MKKDLDDLRGQMTLWKQQDVKTYATVYSPRIVSLPENPLDRSNAFFGVDAIGANIQVSNL